MTQALKKSSIISHAKSIASINTHDSYQDELIGKDMNWQNLQSYGMQTDIGQRDYNEDLIYVIDTLEDVLEPYGYDKVYVVLDGHSGIWAVNFLEENFEQYLKDNFAAEAGHKDNLTFGTAINKTFAQIDKAVIKHLRDNYNNFGESVRYCGSSCTLLFIGKKKISVVNCGDCTACLGMTSKQSVMLTQTHRVMGEGRDIEAEIERVNLMGGWVTAGRVCDVIAVSRSLGDYLLKKDGLQEFLETGVRENRWSTYFAENCKLKGDQVSSRPAIKHMAVAQDSAFVIAASDGLWDVLSVPEAVSFTRKLFQQGKSCQEVANLLIERAIKKGTEDNTSVLVILLNNGSWIGQVKNREYSFMDVLMCGFGSSK